jgi:hypothetical protein
MERLFHQHALEDDTVFERDRCLGDRSISCRLSDARIMAAIDGTSSGAAARMRRGGIA